MDADGFLTLKDRSKDVIISGGSNIYPREVEEVLLRHPGVREVSVVGQPDAEWGEVVVAFVVGERRRRAEALDALCLEHIARFKRPKRYHFVDEPAQEQLRQGAEDRPSRATAGRRGLGPRRQELIVESDAVAAASGPRDRRTRCTGAAVGPAADQARSTCSPRARS